MTGNGNGEKEKDTEPAAPPLKTEEMRESDVVQETEREPERN